MEDFVGLAPTCCVPDSFTVTASGILPPQWLSVSAAARPILLLVQGVLLMSHFHQPGVLKEGSDLEVCKQTGAQVFCANLDNMRLQQADAVAPDNTASAAAEVSRHVHSLRSVLLLLKVAGLLLSSKLRSSALEKATDAVWSAAVGASIQVSDNAMLPVKLADTSHEQYSLLLHLIQMLRPLMRQTAKDKTSYGPLRLCWACCCLKWLLPSSLPSLLQAVAPNIISGVSAARLYFWQHAMPQCPPWLAHHAQHSLPEEEGCPNPMPYIVLLEKYATWQLPDEPSPAPPADGAQAVMRTLYLLVQQLTGIHRKVLETEDIMSDMTDQERSTGHTAILRLETSFTAKREMLGERPFCVATVLCFLHNCQRVLESYEHMRDDVMWSPVIAGLAEGCWTDNRQQARQFKHELASTSKPECRVLPASVGRRLRACFAPLVVKQPDRTQAAAESAYEQLMAEETRAANMAAAKTSKMLRKQAKRQQQQQQSKAFGVESQPLLSEFEKLGLQQQPSAKHQSSALTLTPSGLSIEPADSTKAAMVDGSAEPEAPSNPMEVAAAPADHEAVPNAHHCEDDFLQNLISCPITKEIMREPVIAADGHTYEKAALESWLQLHNTSPVTGQLLGHMRIVPNVLVKIAIDSNLGI